MSRKLSCEPTREIRIRQVSDVVYKDLENIKNFKGITKTQLATPIVVEWINMFPHYMRNGSIQNSKKSEVRLRGLSASTRTAAKNIANYIGVSEESVIKIGLAIGLDKFPAYMKAGLPKQP